MRAIVISDLLSVLLFIASALAFGAWWITIDVGSTTMEWLVGTAYLGVGATLLHCLNSLCYPIVFAKNTPRTKER